MLTDGLGRVRETGERWFEAELHRLTGELMLQLPTVDRARVEARFRHAAAIARRQCADLWELRATTSLARLWTEENRGGEAHDLLAALYSKFTEGFATSDLQLAQRVLCKTGGCADGRPI
jgi:predicted ATPase